MRIILLICSVFCLSAYAAQPRSKTVLAEFQRQNPCPSTGKTKGACEGWIKDHITPLCAGGSDSVDNLQWQTVEDAKKKDAEEKRLCRLKYKGLING